MTLRTIVHSTKKAAVDNAPALLTAVGVAGTVTTAYLTGKASFKAYEYLHDEHELKRVTTRDATAVLTPKEKLLTVWKLYIPAAAVGIGTITAIVFANRIGTRRAVAMAAAYSISEKAYSEYREKVVETIGKNKEEKLRAEIQQEKVKQNPPPDIEMMQGDVWCKDAHSSRYFPSTMEKIKKAQNDTNYEVLNQGYASLTDFYGRLDLEKTKESDDIGWNSDNLLEIMFTTTISDKGQPVLVMDFTVAPVRNYWKSHR